MFLIYKVIKLSLSIEIMLDMSQLKTQILPPVSKLN